MNAARLFASLLIGVALFAFGDAAQAVTFRRPFDINVSLGHGYDHDAGGGCKDYACGGKCYNGHRGSDFPIPYATTIRAAASGTVTALAQGCPDVGFYGSNCNSGFGNYVRITHDDGTWTYYAHMRNGSLTVGLNQKVNCGDKLGESASSGNSTGNHLHFEVRAGGVARDPFAGQCHPTSSYWVGQGAYTGAPSTECEDKCDCSPGQKQSESCGNCGTRHRTCGGNCKWGGWSACEGQGVCSPGSSQSQKCGDCGTETRTCKNDCTWGDYDDCAGPDPDGGAQVCDTQIPAHCAEGRVRCVGGYLDCVTIFPTSEETCNDFDDDCDGVIDNGTPPIADALPAHGATVVDLSYPQVLAAGSAGSVWVRIRNDGSENWHPGQIWLAALGGDEGNASELYPVGVWPAHDVAAVLDEDVRPGETALFSFPISAEIDEGTTVIERFAIGSPDGTPMRCPSPGFIVKVRATAPASTAASGGDLSSDAGPPRSTGGGPSSTSCAAAPGAMGRGGFTLLTALALTAALCRRRATIKL